MYKQNFNLLNHRFIYKEVPDSALIEKTEAPDLSSEDLTPEEREAFDLGNQYMETFLTQFFKVDAEQQKAAIEKAGGIDGLFKQIKDNLFEELAKVNFNLTEVQKEAINQLIDAYKNDLVSRFS